MSLQFCIIEKISENKSNTSILRKRVEEFEASYAQLNQKDRFFGRGFYLASCLQISNEVRISIDDATNKLSVFGKESDVDQAYLDVIGLYVSLAIKSLIVRSGEAPSLDRLAGNTEKLSSWFIDNYTSIANPEVRQKFKESFIANVDIGLLPFANISLLK